ncbi:MAG: DPP IV N-terminal domain-containing protein, partial [Luteimonas sp.]|nr:DPP IV N-terminal domain-containing protein [Luteimonas sp.]
MTRSLLLCAALLSPTAVANAQSADPQSAASQPAASQPAASQPAASQPVIPLTLQQVMADPDWIGPPVEDAWWAWDGRRVQYTLKRDGASIRDTYQQSIDGNAAAERIDGATRATLDGAQPVYDAQRARMAFVRNGDVFVRDLRSGALTQLTRSDVDEARPQWGRDGGLVWRVGNDWYRWDGKTVAQATIVKAEKDPAAAPEADDLRDRQLRLIGTLKDDRARRDAQDAQDRDWRKADPTRVPAPVYLGDKVAISDSALSPDARWLVVVTQAKDAEAGTAGKMPKYVTESGYEEFEEVRTRVGRNAPVPHKLWLVDVAGGKVSELKYDALPGIADDPLAALRKAAKQDPLKGNRDVRIETDGDGSGPAIHWSSDSRNVAVLVRAIDNKDRWLASVDLATAKLQSRHRLHDEAWINWTFNEFDWLPDGSTLWFLSEQSGYSHLYLADGGKGRALTSGRWEVSSPKLSADGRSFLFLCNRAWPGDYEACSVPAAGGAVRELTALDGVESFVSSPDGTKLLVRHSDSYTPPQLAVVDANGDGVVQLTDTRKPTFKAREWIEPEYVQVPSKHGAGTVWGKYYGPKTVERGKKYPIVMFVHGAGYLQNVSDRYPNYFREQMFHNLLV